MSHFLCLHHRGLFYIPSSNTQRSNSEYLNHPVIYYVGDENGERNGARMDLADLVSYNILLLLVLSSYSSIRTKRVLTLECIVSVQTGDVGTSMIFGRLRKNRITPALPFPVITFSLYLLIVNIIPISSNQCIEDSIQTTQAN